MRTAIALDQQAERVGLLVAIDFDGKWDVSLSTPEGQRLTHLAGLTRTSVVAMIAALRAVGDLQGARDPVPSPLHEVKGTGS